MRPDCGAFSKRIHTVRSISTYLSRSNRAHSSRWPHNIRKVAEPPGHRAGCLTGPTIAEPISTITIRCSNTLFIVWTMIRPLINFNTYQHINVWTGLEAYHLFVIIMKKHSLKKFNLQQPVLRSTDLWTMIFYFFLCFEPLNNTSGN